MTSTTARRTRVAAQQRAAKERPQVYIVAVLCVLLVGVLVFELPKLLKFTEDAHTKNMSTFEADEHLRGCKAGPGTYWYAESAAKVLG